MRGADQQRTVLFSFVAVEDRITAAHPLRAIQALVNPILTALSSRFQSLLTIRSERQLMEQLDYNLLFRLFVRRSESR